MRVLAVAAAALFFLVLPARAERAVVDWEFGYVNVRSAPGVDAAQVGRLAAGAEAETLGTRDEWTQIRYAGGAGWVVTRSLKLLPDAPQAAAPAAPPPAPGPPVADEPAAHGPPGADEPAAPGPPGAEKGGGDRGYLSRYLDQPDATPVAPGVSLIRMISGLLLILALVGAAAYAVRRFSGRRFPGDRRGGAIQVLATRSLGPRTGLLLVEVGGGIWLLNQAPEGVGLIAEIRDPGVLRRLNERYGFLEAPFEAELRRQMDAESEEAGSQAGSLPAREPSPEERLAALRRRPGAGGES